MEVSLPPEAPGRRSIRPQDASGSCSRVALSHRREEARAPQQRGEMMHGGRLRLRDGNATFSSNVFTIAGEEELSHDANGEAVQSGWWNIIQVKPHFTGVRNTNE
ncbi:hypothetical protein EYF80_057011 [Liparis tanakae]|uniref:Uncharacterized protein n=1 Tax=Liparis tanakae TaxID=230148 RepID=A0A4Z2EVB0_9TELE|nr:hypothetical protein EYF80_057011 [Liparis tanakae]